MRCAYLWTMTPTLSEPDINVYVVRHPLTCSVALPVTRSVARGREGENKAEVNCGDVFARMGGEGFPLRGRSGGGGQGPALYGTVGQWWPMGTITPSRPCVGCTRIPGRDAV